MIRSGKASKTAHAESAAPLAKPKERAVLEVKAGERITVQWKLNGIDPKGTVKDVTVHFFAVKEEKVGQKSVPKLDKGVVAESALTHGLRPQGQERRRIDLHDRQAGLLFAAPGNHRRRRGAGRPRGLRGPRREGPLSCAASTSGVSLAAVSPPVEEYLR